MKRKTNEISKQLCWTCINAVADDKHGCSWSRSLIPVKGWTAEKSEIKQYEGFEVYQISDCPLYKKGSREITMDDTDDKGFRVLAYDIIKTASREYMQECRIERYRRDRDPALMIKRRLYRGKHLKLYGYKMEESEKKRLEMFFKSDYAMMLSDVNCEYIMQKI